MFLFDNLIIIVSAVQPLIIGQIALMGLFRLSNLSSIFSKLSSIRDKSLNSRVYECSTYSKSNNLFNYSINSISIVMSYLIYDIDLIFLFAEASIINLFNIVDFFFLILFILLFVIGLSIDFKEKGYVWNV